MNAVCLTAGAQVAGLLSSGLSGRVVLQTGESLYLLRRTGDILLLHDARYGFIPFGLGMENAGRLLSEVSLSPGCAVSVRSGVLTLGSETCKLDLSRMQAQSGLVVGLPRRPAGEEIDALIFYAARRGSTGGLSGLLRYTGELCGRKTAAGQGAPPDVFVRKAVPALTVLIRALRTGDVPGMTRGLSGIAGLGPGLTPSGDDVLLGMTAAYSAARQTGLPVSPGAHRLPELILKLYPASGAGISGAYLRSAACGEHFSLLDDVLSQVLDAESTLDPEQCLNRLLGVGSSSGTDMLIGMMLALDTVAERDSE